MPRRKTRVSQEHRGWRRTVVILQAVSFFGLLLLYWRIAWIAVSLSVTDPVSGQVLSTLDHVLGWFLVTFIIIDAWALVVAVYWRPRLLQLLRISFGLTIGLALFTISSAWFWQNFLFFGLVVIGSGLKLSITTRLQGLQKIPKKLTKA